MHLNVGKEVAAMEQMAVGQLRDRYAEVFGEGLEQEFNSLDAQRESAESYIKSQQHEGWTCLPDRYDDGGFTGGNMDRPAASALRLTGRRSAAFWVVSQPKTQNRA